MHSAAQSRTAEDSEQLKHKAQLGRSGHNQQEGYRESEESLPLLQLQGQPASLAQSHCAVSSQDSSCFSWSRPWQLELTQIVRLSAPATIQAASQYCTVVVTMAFVGTLGYQALAAAAVATTYFNFMAAFMAGMSSAFDTLASQAYGAGDTSLVKVWGVTAAAVLTFITVPCSAGLWYGENAASFIFGQGPEVAPMVGSFCRWLIPGLHSFAMSLVLVKMSQVRNEMWMPATVTKAAFSANFGLSMLCVKLCGVWGGALALSITRFLQAAMLLACAIWLPLDWRERWEAWLRQLRQKLLGRPLGQEPAGLGGRPTSSDSASSLNQPATISNKPDAFWPAKPSESGEAGMQLAEVVREGLRLGRLMQFLKLGLPGGLSIAIESGAWESMVAIAGKLGTLEVDATAALLSCVSTLFFVCPYGFAVVATIRVGNLLGAGQTEQAKLTTRVVLICSASVSALAAAIVVVFRHRVGRLFVDDDAVAALVATIAPLAACNFVLDGLQAASGGVLRGMGRQALLLVLGIAGFWGGGVLVSALLAFPAGWGVYGLWLGLNCGTSIVACMYGALLFCVDWRAETHKARAALEAEREQQAAKLQERQQMQMGELGNVNL
ncbi:hypothetical protein WJX74_002488 [Apatococcus lobatus]|uniref:Protein DETOXIFICATION n=1 Tax=Apatococcus lobatus TaxID=904363 RepID=A0AAW1RMT5_9CHLO